MRNLIKKIPYAKAVIRFLKNIPKFFNLLVSDNFRFIITYVPGHFYSPIPNYKDLINQAMRPCDRSVTELAGITLYTQYQTELIKEFSKYYDEMPFVEKKSDSARFCLDN